MLQQRPSQDTQRGDRADRTLVHPEIYRQNLGLYYGRYINKYVLEEVSKLVASVRNANLG